MLALRWLGYALAGKAALSLNAAFDQRSDELRTPTLAPSPAAIRSQWLHRP